MDLHPHRISKLAGGSAALAGALVGLGLYTFVHARGASYLGSDPAACVNCHIMRPQYEAWSRGSHRAVAGCNDCHAPADSLSRKLFVKGVNGFNHSWAFTTGRFHEPIAITDFNRRVVEEACRGCHGAIVQAIDRPAHGEAGMRCTRCHADVGHRR